MTSTCNNLAVLLREIIVLLTWLAHSKSRCVVLHGIINGVWCGWRIWLGSFEVPFVGSGFVCKVMKPWYPCPCTLQFSSFHIPNWQSAGTGFLSKALYHREMETERLWHILSSILLGTILVSLSLSVVGSSLISSTFQSQGYSQSTRGQAAKGQSPCTEQAALTRCKLQEKKEHSFFPFFFFVHFFL